MTRKFHSPPNQSTNPCNQRTPREAGQSTGTSTTSEKSVGGDSDFAEKVGCFGFFKSSDYYQKIWFITIDGMKSLTQEQSPKSSLYILDDVHDFKQLLIGSHLHVNLIFSQRQK